MTRLTLIATLLVGSYVNAQTLSTQTDLLVIPKGTTVGLQATCTGCDNVSVDEIISAVVDDTQYATVEPEVRNVAGSPFVTVFNVKGENQGGTILRLSYSAVGGPPISQKNVTVQVIEDIDDDCIFDDLTASELDRERLLSTLRRYRDGVLESNARGRRYARLYYEHSPEMIRILAADLVLRESVLTLVRKHQASLESILTGQPVKLTAQDVVVIDSVLARMQAQSGPSLDRTLAQLRSDLRDKAVMRSLGAGTRR